MPLAQADDSSGASIKKQLQAVDKSDGDSSNSGISEVKASEDEVCNQRPEDITGHTATLIHLLR